MRTQAARTGWFGLRAGATSIGRAHNRRVWGEGARTRELDGAQVAVGEYHPMRCEAGLQHHDTAVKQVGVLEVQLPARAHKGVRSARGCARTRPRHAHLKFCSDTSVKNGRMKTERYCFLDHNAQLSPLVGGPDASVRKLRPRATGCSLLPPKGMPARVQPPPARVVPRHGRETSLEPPAQPTHTDQQVECAVRLVRAPPPI